MPFSISCLVAQISFRAKAGVPSRFMQAETKTLFCLSGMLSLQSSEVSFHPGDLALRFFNRRERSSQASLPAGERLAFVFQAIADLLDLPLSLRLGHWRKSRSNQTTTGNGCCHQAPPASM